MICQALNLDSWDEICNGCLTDRSLHTVHALLRIEIVYEKEYLIRLIKIINDHLELFFDFCNPNHLFFNARWRKNAHS